MTEDSTPSTDLPLRILHVLDSLDQRYGGPVRAILDLTAHSLSRGLDAEILGVGPLMVSDNPVAPERIHALRSSWPKGYGYLPGLDSWLSEHLLRFDGVVLHGMWMYSNWAFRKACARFAVPYAYFPHGMLEPWAVNGQGFAKSVKKKAYWLLRERAVFEDAVAVLYTTLQESRLALQAFRLPKVKTVIVPYGVSIAEKSATVPDRAELMVPDYVNVGLFLGRLHPKKNVEFLLEAWAEARPKDNWHLIVAGTGEPSYVGSVRRTARELGLSTRVSFPGMVTGNDKEYLFRRASWFFLPSYQENFGNAALEAIHYGCPVVLSDQVLICEFLHEHSEVLPLQFGVWVRFIRERMVDEEWRKSLVEFDRRLTKPRFEIEKIAQGWTNSMRDIFVNRSANVRDRRNLG